MAIRWSTTLLDQRIAPGISSFTSADIPDLHVEFKEAVHWLSNHFLNTALGAPFKPPYRQYATNFIFRTQMAFRYYHLARDATATYLNGNDPHNPRVRAYYEAISFWESALLNWAICLDLVKRMNNEPVFTKGESSTEERAYELANALKHFGTQIQTGAIGVHDTIPVWLTNNGFSSKHRTLTYAEFANLVRDIAKLADERAKVESGV
jgi:hypothetical protein